MTKKLGIIRTAILKSKLKAPKGVRLSTAETGAIIDLWKEDHKVLEKNSTTLVGAEDEIRRVIEYKLPDILTEVTAARTEAARFFKITKDPLKKREWARRLVVAERARLSVTESKKRMEGMTARIKSVVADAALEKKALEIRIAEAEAYQKMGKGLHLVGETLIDARIRASTTSVEFGSLELGLESIESTVRQTSDEKIMKEAAALLKGE